jgi:hypothetical protein
MIEVAIQDFCRDNNGRRYLDRMNESIVLKK